MIVYFLRKHDVILILLIRHIAFTLVFAKAKTDFCDKQYTFKYILNNPIIKTFRSVIVC